MPINYSNRDVNIPTVKRAVGRIDGYDLTKSYRVFGLQQENRPPVLIRADDPDIAAVQEIVEFFRRSGLQVMTMDAGENHDIYVGLRRDVRSNSRLAAAIVKTVVGRMEGKLTLPEDYVIPGASTFASVDEQVALAALSEE